jgi:hypothetical protein|nr:MAG TPA: RNA polymerase I-like protein [Bacteriophage sp.]
MASKVLILFFASLLSLSNAATPQVAEAPQIREESAAPTVSEDSTESVEPTETPEYAAEDEDDSLTVEEKYEHNQNKEDYLEDDGENLIWYDVPYCDNHDYEVIEDNTETMYICKKCGYSYSEFPEETKDEPEEELLEESTSDSEE